MFPISGIDRGGDGRPPSAPSSRGRTRRVDHRADPPAPSADRNVSRPLTSFVGRDVDKEKVLALLEHQRLVTLTGVAGVGKSRLGIEAVTDLVDRRQVSWIDLSAAPDGAAFPGATVVSRPALLLIDNCEPAPETASLLVRRALQDDGTAVLVTSRTPLGLEGEVVWNVAPLPVSDSDEAGAVRLFLDRASAVGRGLEYRDAAHRADVLEICRRLDGIPLAIELATGWLPVLSPREIVARIDDVFGFLVDQRPAGNSRHGSVGASLQQSYELLRPAEAALLRWLSVFDGGCDLRSAEQVCGGEGLVPRRHLLRLLAALARQSLLVSEYTSRGTRYRLHGIVRSFARVQLVKSGEEVPARRRHAAWAVELAERAGRELRTAECLDAQARLDVERENLRAALQWCAGGTDGHRALRLSVALATHWRIRGDLRDGRDSLESALAATGGEVSESGAEARSGLAYFTFMLGDRAEAFRLVEQSVVIADACAGPVTQARARVLLGFFVTFQDPRAAVAPLERAATLAGEAADEGCLAETLAVLGRAHMLAGDSDAASRCWEQSLALAAARGDRHTTCHSLIGLGWIALDRGQYGAGQAHLERAVDAARALGDRFGGSVALCFRGESALLRGCTDDAERDFDEALRLASEMRSPFLLTRCLLGLGRLAQSRGALDAAIALCAEATTLAGRAETASHVRWSQVDLGDVLMWRGHVEPARQLLAEALRSARESGDRRTEARALHGAAVLCRQSGDVRSSKRRHREALAIRVEIDAFPGVAGSMEALAGIAVMEGRDRHAARLFGAAQRLRDSRELGRRPSAAATYESDVAAAKERLGEDEFVRQWKRGAALPLQDAVSQAMHGRLVRSSTTGWASLTPAELRVVRLAEQGLTNPQIGKRLFVSPRTVGTHLSHAFAKLGVSSRVELARQASGRGPECDAAGEYVT